MGLLHLLRSLFGGGGGPARGAEPPLTPDLAGEDVDPFDPFKEPVRLEIKDVFDLHPIPPREGRAVVEEDLREAHGRGFRSVRIIHGKGVGVQRETVRAVLARTPFVEHFADAPPEAGGWGATVAHLHSNDSIEPAGVADNSRG